MKWCLLLVHADSVLGLVEHRVVAVGVLLAAHLVLGRLGGGLLAVWDDVALGLVGAAGEGIADLVDGGLLLIRSNLVLELCEKCQYIAICQEM